MEFLDRLSNDLKCVSRKSDYYLFRCPYCGDSKKSENKGHLYASTLKPVFYCVRCGYGGHIKTLIADLGSNIEIPADFESIANDIKYNRKQKIRIDREEYEDSILAYMKKRLNIEEIDPRLNMISQNTASSLLKNDSFFSDNKEAFISFLSYKHTCIISRDFMMKTKLRYYKSNINDEYDMTDYYIIDDVSSFSNFYNHKTVVLAEGIFDIISQFTYKWVDVPDDVYYLATLSRNIGMSKRNPGIKKQLRGLILHSRPNIVVLADQDTPDEFYKEQLQYSSLKIFRNKSSKDFGVLVVDPYLSFQEAL